MLKPNSKIDSNYWFGHTGIWSVGFGWVFFVFFFFLREYLPAIHELNETSHFGRQFDIRSRGPVWQASGKTFDFNTKMPNYETIFFVVVWQTFCYAFFLSLSLSLPLSLVDGADDANRAASEFMYEVIVHCYSFFFPSSFDAEKDDYDLQYDWK